MKDPVRVVFVALCVSAVTALTSAVTAAETDFVFDTVDDTLHGVALDIEAEKSIDVAVEHASYSKYVVAL